MDEYGKEQVEFARFLAQIGHEIRTPLNAIKGFGDLLAEEQVGPLNAIQKKYLLKIKDSAQQLLQVTNQILDWAKLESNQIKLERQAINLSTVAREVGSLLELRMREKRIQYQVEQADWANVYGDWGRLREVLINLVSNSIKFSDTGGSIEVRFIRREAQVVTCVTDHGCGMSEERLARLFEPFSKGANRPGEEPNTGLGLWICRSMVELHGGYIWVNSRLGEGTSVFFILPCADKNGKREGA